MIKKLNLAILISISTLILMISLLSAKTTNVSTVRHIDKHRGEDGILYMTEIYPPIQFLKDGKLTGFCVELLYSMWKEMGQKPQKIKVFPWARGMHYLEKSKNSVLFSAAWSEARAKKFKYVMPSHYGGVLIIARKDKKIRLKSVDDINNYTSATVQNDIAEAMLIKKGVLKKNIEPTASYANNLKKLNKGRVELMAVGLNILPKILKQTGLNGDDYEIVYVVEKGKSGFMFNSQTPDNVIKKFQKALDAVRSGPIYKDLLIKYGLSTEFIDE